MKIIILNKLRICRIIAVNVFMCSVRLVNSAAVSWLASFGRQRGKFYESYFSRVYLVALATKMELLILRGARLLPTLHLLVHYFIKYFYRLDCTE